MFFLFVWRFPHFFFALPCFLIPYYPSNISLYLFLTWQLFDSCWCVFCVSCIVCQRENCFACLFILPLLSLELSIGGRILCYQKAHRFYIQHGIFCVASWILAQSSQLSEWLWFWCSHFIFLIFFCPIKFFLFEFSGGWEMRFMSVTEILLKRKMFKLFAKLIMRGQGVWCCQNSQAIRKILKSNSHLYAKVISHSLPFFAHSSSSTETH